MAEAKTSDGERPRRRRWSFADCVFDEANWTLTVDGRRVQVELKPLELLRELLLQGGNLVSKDALLDAIWPDVTVVEASLPTAVRKLRLALDDDQRPAPIIETVPRIGYRLAVPVTIEEPVTVEARNAATGAGGHGPPAATAVTGRRGFVGRRGLLSIAAVAAIAIGATAFTLASSPTAPAARPAPPINSRDAEAAIRRLDVPEIERLLAAGWDPNAQIGDEGNAALHYLMEVCEWNPGHDRNRLLLMARTLFEGGGRLDQRNIWGDTPYSIAKSPRYCGPDHPVTQSFRATCYNGGGHLGDRCLASYEVVRRNPH
jgi:DNA-binding winged helix-turn-helix (wHTH) protein